MGLPLLNGAPPVQGKRLLADGLALLLHEKTTDCTKLISDTQVR